MPTVEPVTRISLKNILVPTDFSPASVAAVPFALAIARMYGSEITVAHVVAPEPHGQVVFDRVPAQDNLPWSEARQGLLEFVHGSALESPTCRTLMEQGDIADVIPSLILQNQIDLVVMGTRGHRGLRKVVLGSSAEKIYRLASCPVLTVGPQAFRDPANPWRITSILFPVDLAENPAPILHYALSLAEEQQAALILLHSEPLVPWQHRPAVQERALRRLSTLIPEDEAHDCKPESLVRWEHPVEAILATAQEREADLIVMGVHKARAAGLSSHLPWPVASEVVSRARCPVLTVRV